MNNEDLGERLVAVEERSKSNTKRIDKLEENSKALTDLTVAVKEMVVKQDTTTKSIDKLDKKMDGIDNRIDNIEKKPAKKWEGVVEKVIYTVIAIIVGFLFSKIGVK